MVLEGFSNPVESVTLWFHHTRLSLALSASIRSDTSLQVSVRKGQNDHIGNIFLCLTNTLQKKRMMFRERRGILEQCQSSLSPFSWSEHNHSECTNSFFWICRNSIYLNLPGFSRFEFAPVWVLHRLFTGFCGDPSRKVSTQSLLVKYSCLQAQFQFCHSFFWLLGGQVPHHKKTFLVCKGILGWTPCFCLCCFSSKHSSELPPRTHAKEDPTGRWHGTTGTSKKPPRNGRAAHGAEKGSAWIRRC